MVDQIIRPADLPNRASPNASEKIPVDNGSSVAGATVESIVLAGRPTASQAEAEAGTDAVKAMTPLTVDQKIEYEIGRSIASKAQGDKADSAVQPSDLADVATTGDYDDLLNKPIIPPGLSDGDKGDITVSSLGTAWTVNAGLSSSKISYLLSATDAQARPLTDKLGDSISVKDFGAKGDGKRLWAAATINSGSNSLYAAVGPWTVADVGKRIIVSGAGASGADLVTTITAVPNSQVAELGANAGTTRTAVNTLMRWGSDDTAALQAAFAYAAATLPNILIIPKGNYFYTGLGNLRYDGLVVAGANMMGSILTYCGAGGSDSAAIMLNAFPGTEVNPFLQYQSWSNLTIEAHSTVSHGISAQGLARSVFENINIRECSVTATGDPRNRHAILFRGCMLNRLVGCYVSDNLQPMAATPFGGIYLTEGRRNGVSIGQSTNNVILHCYWEGLTIGANYHAADGNLMLGGSPEKCSQYGMIVQGACRFNTFIGVGFENLGATRDVSDSGVSSKYINCYSSESFLSQGRACVVEGGIFERLEFGASAIRGKATDLTINHWNTGAGGFINASPTTTYKNIYDSDAAAYITQQPARQGITVTASPFLWTNTTGMTVNVVLQGGTITELVRNFGATPWTLQNTTNTEYTLRPGDSIRVGYSSAPTMSYYVNTGYQG